MFLNVKGMFTSMLTKLPIFSLEFVQSLRKRLEKWNINNSSKEVRSRVSDRFGPSEYYLSVLENMFLQPNSPNEIPTQTQLKKNMVDEAEKFGILIRDMSQNKPYVWTTSLW